MLSINKYNYILDSYFSILFLRLELMELIINGGQVNSYLVIITTF